MKRLYAALALTLFLTVIGFFAIRTVNNSYNILNQQLNECDRAFQNGNATEKCKAFEKDLAKREKMLCVFVNRSVLDEVTLYASRMTVASNTGDENAFYSELSSLRLCLYKMKSDENFSILSFF